LPHETRFAQEEPAVGGDWHVPHADAMGTAQYADAHWALAEQPLPMAPDPAGDWHAVGVGSP
jgi:hypothetical protein